MSDQDRASLEFKGSGSEYFKIWIVNLFLSILTLGIYSAWAKVRRKRYLYGNTSVKGASFEYHASPLTILKGRLIAVALLIVYSVLSELYPLLGFSDPQPDSMYLYFQNCQLEEDKGLD